MCLTIASIRGPRIAEVVLDSGLKAKAAVFQKYASEIRLDEKNSQDLQVLARRILTDSR